MTHNVTLPLRNSACTASTEGGREGGREGEREGEREGWEGYRTKTRQRGEKERGRKTLGEYHVRAQRQRK